MSLIYQKKPVQNSYKFVNRPLNFRWFGWFHPRYWLMLIRSLAEGLIDILPEQKIYQNDIGK
jgi:hypothetical protein